LSIVACSSGTQKDGMTKEDGMMRKDKSMHKNSMTKEEGMIKNGIIAWAQIYISWEG